MILDHLLHVVLCSVSGSKNKNRMDQITAVLEPAKQFTKDSIRLVKRCTKPDRKGMMLASLSFVADI